jgi:hypothetical protein
MIDFERLRNPNIQRIDIRNVTCGTVFVTTNQYIKSNLTCVMGRGTAKTLCEMFPDDSIPWLLATRILNCNSNVGILKRTEHVDYGYFHVKPNESKNKEDVLPHYADKFKGKIPGWACKADFGIIERSLKTLKFFLECQVLRLPVYLPMAGCGAGGLDQEDVVKLINKIGGLNGEHVIFTVF